MEESVEVRKDGKKHIVRNVLLIAAACSVPATFVCVILCGNMRTVRNKMLDAENGKAKSILRAAQSQADENCYSKNGRSIPANREYIVRYYVGDKGWVNEPCELLPDSIVNQYYTTSDTREKAVVKFVDGKACEACTAVGGSSPTICSVFTRLTSRRKRTAISREQRTLLATITPSRATRISTDIIIV